MVGVVFCRLRFLLELKFTWHHVSHNLVGDHEIFHEPCLKPCSYPHHCPGEQSRNGQEIHDHPSMLQFYRYSTPEALLSELLWSSLSMYFFFFLRFLFPSLPFFPM